MHGFEGVAESPAIRRLLDQASQFAKVPRPILIRGERGTGKELLARYVHQQSPRTGKPFVTINCAAFNDELLNAEMYGAEKGAYTGAQASREGRLEQAHTGSLFMDEIGNMSMSFQETILRVLEYQEFHRVGGTRSIKVDVRLISATNADLEEMMENGRFRPDLYDRISFAVLQLPPLRQRREDIPHLVVHIVKQLHAEIPNLLAKRFSRQAVEAMMDYYWPGNIRELRNVVERVYVFGLDDEIRVEALPPEITSSTTAPRPIANSVEGFHEQVEAFKQHLILNTLATCKGNQREAARQLQMTYDQFRHFYRKYSTCD